MCLPYRDCFLSRNEIHQVKYSIQCLLCFYQRFYINFNWNALTESGNTSEMAHSGGSTAMLGRQLKGRQAARPYNRNNTKRG